MCIVLAYLQQHQATAVVGITSINQTKTLDHVLVQNLTKTNVPVTLALTRGYVNGFEVFYISTEASDKGLAHHLTNFTHSRVSFASALKNAPPQSLANIYVFRNGIKGSGPLGFQPNVADSQPGDPGYSPLWRINNVEWKQGVSPKELKSETDIQSAQKNGELTISSSDAIVNCPFVYWHGGSLKERTDKTLTDLMAYGGAQVLNIDIKKMQVTFVGHRGFAPDGSTIYYIATDASVKKVADKFGVTFVNKTGADLAFWGIIESLCVYKRNQRNRTYGISTKYCLDKCGRYSLQSTMENTNYNMERSITC